MIIASESVTWTGGTATTDEVCAVGDVGDPDPLDVINRRQPRIVVLEEAFACTERGAALVGQLQTDPAYQDIDVRLLLSERLAQIEQHGTTMALVALAQPIRPVYWTIRRTPRRKISGAVKMEIDGSPCTLVDLSLGGAQVLATVALRPHQRLHAVIADTLRLEAKVVWVKLAMAPALRYRAGLEFLETDVQRLSEVLSSF